MESLEILIVEDEVIIAETLQEMLSQLGYRNVHRCKTQDSAEKIIRTGNLGLAILDINLDGHHEGIELGHLCSKKRVPYFFLTSYSDRKTIMEAKEAKPGNYVIKPFSPEEIMVAIELTLMHNVSEDTEKIKRATETFGLSVREAEILGHIFKRLSNQEIGEKLYLSLNTVKYHLRHIYVKTGVSTKQGVVDIIDQL